MANDVRAPDNARTRCLDKDVFGSAEEKGGWIYGLRLGPWVEDLLLLVGIRRIEP